MIGLARGMVQATVLVWVLCGALQAHATVLRGEVVALADGDTITVLDADRRQHKVRLAGIDAPEKRQSFGTQSKDSLASMVFRRQVVVEWSKYDRYGRVIGKVLVGNLDVCLEQVRLGMAWHYKRYAPEQSAADQAAYAAAETDARRAARGLWRDAAPVPPWEFRRHQSSGTHLTDLAPIAIHLVAVDLGQQALISSGFSPASYLGTRGF